MVLQNPRVSDARRRSPLHRLTLPKGIYSLRYFLSPMRIPNLLIHVFIIPKRFSKMNIDITIFGVRIGDRKDLNEYTPFGSVSVLK